MVSDVLPDSAAEEAGLAIADVVETVNGKLVESVPMLSLELSRYAAGETLTLGLLRGAETMSAQITVRELPHPIDDLSALADPEKGSVPKLGIIGIDVADETAASVACAAYFIRRLRGRAHPRVCPATGCRWSPGT